MGDLKPPAGVPDSGSELGGALWERARADSGELCRWELGIGNAPKGHALNRDGRERRQASTSQALWQQMQDARAVCLLKGCAEVGVRRAQAENVPRVLDSGAAKGTLGRDVAEPSKALGGPRGTCNHPTTKRSVFIRKLFVHIHQRANINLPNAMVVRKDKGRTGLRGTVGKGLGGHTCPGAHAVLMGAVGQGEG